MSITTIHTDDVFAETFMPECSSLSDERRQDEIRSVVSYTITWIRHDACVSLSNGGRIDKDHVFVSLAQAS